MLTVDEIKKFIDDDKTSEKKRFAKVGERYYDGDNDIKQYRLFYYNADGNLVEDKTRSNVKIPHLSGGAVYIIRQSKRRTHCAIG